MEATVRYIPTEVTTSNNQEVAAGNKPALCFRGKTYAIGIINDQEGILPVRLNLKLHDTSPVVTFGKSEEEYPVSRFITHIERIMKEKPISEEALQLIRTWPNLPNDFGDAPDEPATSSKPLKRPSMTKSNIIATIAQEMKTPPTKIRKFLRAQGMKAPYDNEPQIRKLMKKYKEKS